MPVIPADRAVVSCLLWVVEGPEPFFPEGLSEAEPTRPWFSLSPCDASGHRPQKHPMLPRGSPGVIFLQASGHVDRFSDFLVRDSGATSQWTHCGKFLWCCVCGGVGEMTTEWSHGANRAAFAAFAPWGFADAQPFQAMRRSSSGQTSCWRPRRVLVFGCLQASACQLSQAARLTARAYVHCSAANFAHF